jgi:hypothetical protein
MLSPIHLKPSRAKKSQDKISIADPNLNPDVFGLTGSGSGSFFHQAKKVRKTLIPNVL